MQKIYKNTQGYSIIIAIMMVAFLLVLCSWVLQGVLWEMIDNRWRQEYLKASAAAEGALELALLDIKKNWYGYDAVENDILYLWDDRKNARMQYNFKSRVQEHEWQLWSFETVLIPLYWINMNGLQAISWTSIELNASEDLIWNIIGSWLGISGEGSFTEHTQSQRESIDGTSTIERIWNFLDTNPGSYLQIYNNSSLESQYLLKVEGDDFFTLPKAEIFARWSIGKYQQSLRAELNNTEFLHILRYSIFSQ